MLRIRHLRLRSITSNQRYGADLELSSGLNVIYAGNTSGKSTCLQSIVYALGLERSLGPQLEVPLPYAMRERIHAKADDPYEPVIESYVELEIQNAEGDILAIRRDIVGGKDRKLIQTWNVPTISAGAQPKGHRDFFVHDQGAAQRDDGFHSFLAKFLRWELPQVPRFDGTECPLYLEAIFPMLFVEQKRGWSTIQGPFPTFLRIQDVARRVMEYLLGLETGRIRRARSELRRRIAGLEQDWQSHKQSLEQISEGTMRFRGLRNLPTAEFAQTGEFFLEVMQADEWIPIDEVIQGIHARLSELQEAGIPTAEQAASQIESQLTAARDEVDRISALLETVRTEYSNEMQEFRSVESRLHSLEIDLKRNQDALKLKNLGSDLGSASRDSTCPTCHQHVSTELLPITLKAGMALDENIVFLKSQIELYRAALERTAEQIEHFKAQYLATSRDLNEKRQEVRALRQSLVQPSEAPSHAAIEEAVRWQARAERLTSIREKIDEMADALRLIAKSWANLQATLRALPPDQLTALDMEKISLFQQSIRTHLSQYRFKSFQPNEISISEDNFRPLVLTRIDDEEVEKEINFELSASDAIRLKWAYYLSLLSVASARTTNHCGMVVFDEPGQQEMEVSSLHAFLKWSTESISDFQHVIVATSEPL